MSSLDATTMRPPKRDRHSPSELPVLTLTIAAHADPARVGQAATIVKGCKVSRLEPEFTAAGKSLPLGDPNISRRPFELVVRGDEVEVRAEGGGSALSIAGVPLTDARILSAAEVERGVALEIAERVVLVLRRSRTQRGGGEEHGIIGVSAEVGWMIDQVERAAGSTANVLVRGATGTGKELVAAAIHRQSDRAGGPFIAVNMTTLPASTATSQLFGHQRGAFTGAAADHKGFFAAADGGTLFLDEVGETPADVQAMLLRSLETGTVTPVGATTSTAVDVRIVAATDADLEGAVEREQFRSPLFHRLAGYQIELPTLAARREDIGPLLYHFLGQELHKVGSSALEPKQPTEPLWLSTTQIAKLIRHRWPGNVRQLRNLARHLAISSGDAAEVSESELERGLGALRRATEPPPPSSASTATPTTATKRKPEDITDDELIDVLRNSAWKTSAAAKSLGISRTSLYTLIERCDRVRKARDIDEAELTGALTSASGDTAAAARELEVSERGLKLRMKELGIVG